MKAYLLDKLGLSFTTAPWLPEVFTVVLGVLALNLAASLILRRLQRLAGRTVNVWDDALVQALRRPLTVMLWIVGIGFAAGIVRQRTGAPIFQAVGPIRDIGVIVCLTWFLVRLIRNVEAGIGAQRRAHGIGPVDLTSVDAISKLLRLSVIITAVLVTLQTLGFSISGVLAFGGIGGIAVGFAAKDILANLFGGLTVYLDRPFSVGEWIRSPDKNIEGTVEHIGWRQTRIRGFNKNPLYVPNALFTTIVVENPTRMSNRRIKETIGIRYEDLGSMAAIVDEVRSMLGNHPEIDTGTTLIVNFNEFADSSLNFFIYCFTKTKEWVHYHAVKQDVLLKVADIIAAHGAEIAFPTRTLHLVQDPGASPPLP
jgi:MscS family membrane protein